MVLVGSSSSSIGDHSGGSNQRPNNRCAPRLMTTNVDIRAHEEDQPKTWIRGIHHFAFQHCDSFDRYVNFITELSETVSGMGFSSPCTSALCSAYLFPKRCWMKAFVTLRYHRRCISLCRGSFLEHFGVFW